MSFESAYEAVRFAGETCIDCARCTKRCEVPYDAQERTVGQLARVFLEAMNASSANSSADTEIRAAAIRDAAQRDASAVLAARRCCMCDYCTQSCPVDVDARTVFASIRELLSLAGVITSEGFESTQVDTPWHIFSVYRSVYGINFVDLPHIEHARDFGADTLFFPGCPLTSYAPELTREVFSFLGDQGINAVISEECCGSPLKSAGFGERARLFKERLSAEMKEAGIKKIICICPGCMSELGSDPYIATLEFVPLTAVLADAGLSVDTNRIAAMLEEKGKTVPPTAEPHATVFDACYDREGFFGEPLRKLFTLGCLTEMEHSRNETICCGAGGAVGLVDGDLSARRAQRSLDEAEQTAELLVTNCSICSYTFSYHQRSCGEAEHGPAHCNYLELVFENRFEWEKVFSQLEGMWSGEYGPWVIQQLT